MKKLTAIILSLVLVLALVCTAAAESRTFALAGLTDSEGNALPVAEEDIPDCIVTIDDEALTCSYETAEAVEEGTCELLGLDETAKIAQIRCTFPEDVLDFTYDADNEMLYLSDPVNSIIYIYARVEPTAAE